MDLPIAGGHRAREIFLFQIPLDFAPDEVAPLFHQLLFLREGVLANWWIVGLLDFLHEHLLYSILGTVAYFLDLWDFHIAQGRSEGFDDGLYLGAFAHFIGDIVGPRGTMDQLWGVEVSIIEIERF